MYTQLYKVKKHLNIDEDFLDDDEYLAGLAEVCEGIVERNLDVSLRDLEDGEGGLPSPLEQAVLFLVAHYYANRENVAFTQANNVPYSFQYIIDLYRDYRGPIRECPCPKKKKKEDE